MELEPESQDAFHGTYHEANRALVYAQTGEREQAIAILQRLLSTPGPIEWLGGPRTITLAILRLGWLWDPLRNDPRFQEILKGSEPKTAY